MEPLKLDHFETLVQFPRPGFRAPMAFQFADDGQTLYYLYASSGEALCLWAADRATGSIRLVAEPPEKGESTTFVEEMRRQRLRWSWGGITQYQWCGQKLLVPYGGNLYVKVGDAHWRRVPVSQEVVAARWSPKGDRVFGVIEGNLVWIDLNQGTLHPITTSAGPGVYYGVAEYVAQEEFDRSTGYWVSPDGEMVVFAEVDEREVPEFPIVHLGADPVQLEAHRYPLAGKGNAQVRLGISPVEGPSDQWRWIPLDLTERYLLDLLWANDETFLVLTVSRDQRHLAWDRYNRDGAYQGRVYEETSPYWINRPGRSYVSSTGLLVTTSERTGFRRVLVIDEKGQARDIALPDGGAVVIDILNVHWEETTAYVWMTRHRALERTIVALNWSTGSLTELTPDPGWHQGIVAPDGQSWVDQVSNWDVAPETRWVSRQAPEAPKVLYAPEATRRELGLVRPTLFELEVAPRVVVNGIFYPPIGDPPAGGWPMVVFVYGGPHVQMVTAHWDATVDLPAQYLVNRGFAVMKVDSRGSANRGVDFERPLFRHFGRVELEDQRSAVAYAIRRWPINPQRIGIFGGSYGGYMTIRALLMAPEVFRVGVAVAPVTDFRWYDTGYTERYLGTPEANESGYEDTSVVNKADRLQGKLLIIHGMVDENVHFRHTAQFLQALIRAGKDVDLVLLPESRHMVQGFENLLYRTRRTVTYFEEHL